MDSVAQFRPFWHNTNMAKQTPRPHFEYETHFAGRMVCGIDEAGRGPLAGPVTAAAVIVPDHVRDQPWVHDLRDSKLLSAEMRGALYDRITSECVFGIGQASVEEIDSLNILQATFLAMCRARAGLDYPDEALVALVDGNLKPKGLMCEIVTIVKGDQQSYSIAAASILAKVTRDWLMQELCSAYPAYGFSHHAGYGTPKHLQALADHGPCQAHRQSFKPVAQYL